MPKSVPRDLSFSTVNSQPVIMTPDALPLFADEDYLAAKRKKNKESKLRKPMEPLRGAGKGGRLGASATAPMMAHMFIKGDKDEDVSRPQATLLLMHSHEKLFSGTQRKRKRTRRGRKPKLSRRHYRCIGRGSISHLPPGMVRPGPGI